MKNVLSPIIVFAYNRPNHLQRTIEALANNELASESLLYIYCDGPKEGASEETLLLIKQTRDYARSVTGFKNVIVVEQPVNKGLDPSEIDAITEVINKHGKMISVEDDLITNKFFLRFMNEALDFYEEDKRIYQIAGFVDAIAFPKSYKHNIFASYRTESCGWATWKNRWEKVNWNEKEYDLLKHPTRRSIKKFNRGGDDFYPMLLDKATGKTDAWDIRWAHTMYLNDGLCVRPTKSLLYNIGFDGTGVHCGVVEQSVVLSQTASLFNEQEYNIKLVKRLKVNNAVQSELIKYFKLDKAARWMSFPKKLKKIIKSYAKLLHLI